MRVIHSLALGHLKVMNQSPASFPRRVAEYIKQEGKVLEFFLRNPGDLALLPRYLRERDAPTIELRSPWWPYSAIDWVGAALPQHPRVFEFGGGGSTLWLEDQGAAVTVVEHDEHWHHQLAPLLGTGTRLLFRPTTASGAITSVAAPGYFDSYVNAIEEEADNSLDLVIVDGRARVECARQAKSKVKPGGLLLFDDTDRPRYQPAIDMLSSWERHDFAGVKPGQRHPAQTSAWKRPAGY